MAYSPQNNPYIPGDPYSYDLKWIVERIKSNETSVEQAVELVKQAEMGAHVAPSAADFINKDLIYVYTGSEAGYISGNWYYWNGSAWASGGAYGSGTVDAALSSTSINPVQNRVINAALSAKQDALSFPLSIAQGGTGQDHTFSDTSDSDLHYYKFGNVVTLDFRGKLISSIVDGHGTVGTIQAGYRPPAYLYAPIIYYDGNDQYIGRLIINSTGTTEIVYLASNRWQTPTTNGRIQGFVTYLIS